MILAARAFFSRHAGRHRIIIHFLLEFFLSRTVQSSHHPPSALVSVSPPLGIPTPIYYRPPNPPTPLNSPTQAKKNPQQRKIMHGNTPTPLPTTQQIALGAEGRRRSGELAAFVMSEPVESTELALRRAMRRWLGESTELALHGAEKSR